ncbi:hypothetical protein GGR57DRAFT_475464 [Xylariaceae sp. FL1272]|nr:hypothetical protein GGR57DRAFT_475464 [Xylariaceae sp. FL1272]
MHYKVVFSCLALVTSALAQVLEPSPTYPEIYFPRENETIVAGSSYIIEWDQREQVGPATLYLLGGDDAASLRVVSTIAKVHLEDQELRYWEVDCELGTDKAYVIKIASDLDNGKTYGVSPVFHLCGPTCHASFGIYPTPSSPAVPSSYSAKPTCTPYSPPGSPGRRSHLV